MKKFMAWHALSIFVMFLMSAITLSLLACALLNTFKTSTEILQNMWALPSRLTFANYRRLLVDEGYLEYFKNSIIISLSVLITTYISAMAAYGMSKFDFKSRNILKIFFIIGLFFPIRLAISSLYILMKQLDLINQPVGLMILYCSFVSMPIFIMTGMMKSISDSIIESAKIEGAGYFRIFNQIILPMSKSSIGAIAPLLFTGAWNDFMLPKTMLNIRSAYTVPLGITIYNMGTFYDLTHLDMVYTSVILSILPIVTIYLVFSRQIISGVMTGSIKD